MCVPLHQILQVLRLLVGLFSGDFSMMIKFVEERCTPLNATQNAGPIFYREPEDARVKKITHFQPVVLAGSTTTQNPCILQLQAASEKNALKNGSPFFNVII